MHLIKKFFAPFIIVVIISLIILGFRQSSKTIYNPDDAIGNTAGNLFNGGLYCEDNNNIYFSNDNDYGALYRMDSPTGKFKKIHDDKTAYLNVIGKYIYYSRINNTREESSPSIFAFNNVGIYRLDSKSKQLKSLYDDPSGLINVYGNYVYYQHFNSNEGLTFHSVKIDGSNDTLLSNEPIMPLSINEGLLIFSGADADHNIHTIDLNTGVSNVLYEENCYAPIYNNGYIYFMSVSNDYAIYRINEDGTDPTEIVKNRCSTFNITNDGKYMYYQVDDTKNNGINRINLLTGEIINIKTGDYKQIHIVKNYVFFRDFSETNTYYIPVESTNNISIFNPPKVK
jgi:hypothetical protein